MNASGPVLRICTLRILVVEEDFVSANSLRLALSVDGHEVDLASDGEEALSLFDQKEHDVVITDFQLPTMDGLDLAAAIKQRAPSRPVILMTSYTSMVQGPLGQVSNVDVLLSKPVSVSQLQAALRKLFAAPVHHA